MNGVRTSLDTSDGPRESLDRGVEEGAGRELASGKGRSSIWRTMIQVVTHGNESNTLRSQLKDRARPRPPPKAKEKGRKAIPISRGEIFQTRVRQDK